MKLSLRNSKRKSSKYSNKRVFIGILLRLIPMIISLFFMLAILVQYPLTHPKNMDLPIYEKIFNITLIFLGLVLSAVVARYFFKFLKKTYSITLDTQISYSYTKSLEYAFNTIKFINSLVFFRIENKGDQLREFAISLIYLKHLKKKHRPLKFILLIFSVTLATFASKYGNNDLISLVIVAILLFVLIELKEVIIEYRIHKGWFGTTCTEARDMINFLIENAADIDFTDTNGKPRRTLFPEEPKVSDASCDVVHGEVPA